MHNPNKSFLVEYRSLIQGSLLYMQIYIRKFRAYLFGEAEIDVEIASYATIKTQKSI